jgi:hypothetical protein
MKEIFLSGRILDKTKALFRSQRLDRSGHSIVLSFFVRARSVPRFRRRALKAQGFWRD